MHLQCQYPSITGTAKACSGSLWSVLYMYIDQHCTQHTVPPMTLSSLPFPDRRVQAVPLPCTSTEEGSIHQVQSSSQFVDVARLVST